MTRELVEAYKEDIYSVSGLAGGSIEDKTRARNHLVGVLIGVPRDFAVGKLSKDEAFGIFMKISELLRIFVVV